jgi:predicted RNA-binding protein with PIN domain
MAVPQPSSPQIRSALEHALEVSRGWGRKRDTPLPGRVQELVNSRRRDPPSGWTTTMRRALELDDAFRAEVAASATEETLGRQAWLWLARPEGWQEELGGILAEAQQAADAEKSDRLAKIHLDDVERRLSRAEKEITRLQDVNNELAAEAVRARQDVSRMEAELAAARGAQQRGEARGREVEELLARAERAAAGRDRRHDVLITQLDEARALIARLESDLEQARAHTEDARRREQVALALSARAEEDLAIVRSQVAEAVGRAASAVNQLAPSLSAAMDALGLPASTPAEPARAVATPRSRRRAGSGRPLSLPPAIFEDSPQAVDYLLRVPGVQLIVDGYNVALTSWPGGELPELRDRLVAALAELALRQRVEVHVVFDGAGEGGRVPPPPAARRLMKVSFSASNVEADDEILAAVDRLEPAQPVIVATDDRAVRDAARVRRANVISVAQLLDGLGRRHTPLK